MLPQNKYIVNSQDGYYLLDINTKSKKRIIYNKINNLLNSI